MAESEIWKKANALRDGGRPEAAADLYRGIYSDSTEIEEQLKARQHAGVCYRMLGNHEAARTLLSEVLETARQQRLSAQLQGVTERDLASAFLQAGSYGLAFEHLHQSRETFHAAGDRAGEATTVRALALARLAYGDMLKAHGIINEAFQLLGVDQRKPDLTGDNAFQVMSLALARSEILIACGESINTHTFAEGLDLALHVMRHLDIHSFAWRAVQGQSLVVRAQLGLNEHEEAVSYWRHLNAMFDGPNAMEWQAVCQLMREIQYTQIARQIEAIYP